MPDWMMQIMGSVYNKIPKSYKPYVKACFNWTSIRIKALASFRKIYKIRQVRFLDFEIAHLENCEILAPGKKEVFVEASKSIVSPGTENAVLCGLPGARRSFPYAPGYSLAGRLLKTGRHVKDFAPGDAVVGQINHMSHQVLSPAKLFKIPPEVSFEEAGFMEIAIICLQGIRKAGIAPGDRVAVVGQGLIGQFCNKLVRLCGAAEVIAVASSRNRQKTAIAPGGADRFVALSENGRTLSEIQADVVIEAVGSPSGVETAFKAARDEGKVVLLGSSRGIGRNVDWSGLVQRRGLQVIGAHISNMPLKDNSRCKWTYRAEGELFLDLLKEKRLSVSDLITWKAAPEDCNQVYETLAEGGKDHVAIMFDWKN